ncbi:TspO/MBR family protein [Cyanobacterium sp. Dongsha4]|uniref:TspO/MBR family protein n=1 Tax=Cyanobacterium sp. DS4 TaxID=2878255 RepID=UPI002E80F6A9|nr:tryptophan-rich sensory protein [Cyanobacterium sp. Dongsha4]WVK99390.1 tryptophan-rich sensory protein [Cyanobacterium sp. Dongsha4]
MFLPSWLIIGAIALLLSIVINRIPADDLRWFFRLKRPSWLTFEFLIPFIWIFIFVCLVLSASLVWDSNINLFPKITFMSAYVILQMSILAYTRVMCAVRSLVVGTAIGAFGFFIGLILAFFVAKVDYSALALLMPYLLWSPIGTYVTWAMIPLNRSDI